MNIRFSLGRIMHSQILIHILIRKHLIINNSVEITFKTYCVTHKQLFIYKDHSQKYLASTPSFTDFGFLFSPSGSLNRPFNTQTFPLSFSSENLTSSKTPLSFNLVLFIVVFHIQGSLSYYTRVT